MKNTASIISTEHKENTLTPVYSGLYRSIIQYIDICQLKLPRTERIGKQTLTAFSESIRENGFLRPVYISTDFNVCDGIKRIAAARTMGYFSVPFVYAPTPLVFEDDLIIVKEYPARETPEDGKSAKELFFGIDKKEKRYFDYLLDVAAYLQKNVAPGDVIAVLGAGDVNLLCKILTSTD